MPIFYWFLACNEGMASVRMQSLRIHHLLLHNGYRSELIQCPDFYTTNLLLSEEEVDLFCKSILKKGDIVVVHKLECPSTKVLCNRVNNAGAFVVYFTCDLPLLQDYQSLINLLIVPSLRLKELYRENGYQQVALLEDVPEVFMKPRVSSGNDVLRCVWFGIYDQEKWQSFIWLKNLLESNFSGKILVESISDYRLADFHWNNNSLKTINKNYDLVLLPTKEVTLSQDVKSSNKLLQSMALGLPVLVSPLNSYERVLSEYEHDITCKTELDWKTKISRLFDSGYRASVGRYNYSFVRTRCSEEVYINSFLNIIQSIFQVVDKTANTCIRDEKQLSSIKASVYLKGMNVEKLFHFRNLVLILKRPNFLSELFFRTTKRVIRRMTQIKHMWI